MFNLKSRNGDKGQDTHPIDPPTSKNQSEEQDDGQEYPTGLRLGLIFASLILTVFLCALDGTIIATAIPTITAEFNSLNDVAWYNSAYLLCTCAFQLPFGRAYTLLDIKWTYLASIVIFEIGSAISGATPTSIGLIIGRAIQGIGGSGIFGGSFIIIAKVIPLSKRALFNGVIGGTFAIASVVGPLLGGAFTTSVTWRWCFYINLPLGAIALVVGFFFLQIEEQGKNSFKDQTAWQILWRFDPIGTLILLPSIICLLLALTWGGQLYPWSDGRIIALLVCFGVSIIGWIILQYFEGENATLSFEVASQRTVACATIFMLLGSAAFSVVIYYLPLWFQGIKQDNAQQSGIHQIPLVISLVVFSLACGGGTVAFGYYVPFLYLGTVLMSIGAALLTLLQPSSGIGEWLGFQIVFGAGVGACLEQCNIAIQTVLPQRQIAAGTSLAVFARSLGAAVAIAIAESIFEQRLRSGLSAVSGIDPSIVEAAVEGSGATNLVSNLEAATGGNQGIVDQILAVYNNALTDSFYLAVVLACITLIPALGVEWKSVKNKKQGGDEESKQGSGETKTDAEDNNEREAKPTEEREVSGATCEKAVVL